MKTFKQSLNKSEPNPELATGVKISTNVTDAQPNKTNTGKSVARPPRSVVIKPSIKEDAPAMSVGSGAVSPIAPPDASAAYSLQKDRMKKKIKTNLVNRKSLE